MRAWKELDVTSWPQVHQETRGRRVKLWVEAPDGSHWLRKEPRDSRPFEPAIEALMLRLAEEVGVTAAEGSVCVWLDGSEMKRGLIVRLFLNRKREQLALGRELLKQHDTRYVAEAKWEHTLARVRAALLRVGSDDTSLTLAFAKMLAFDAWIGNGDRHQENWGVIEPTGAGPTRLAPMFDPASCLGTELQEHNRHLDGTACTTEEIEGYTSRCPSGFGDGHAPINLEGLAQEAGQWPEWKENVRSWLAEFSNGMDTFREFLSSVPDLWLPPPRKLFALRLLEHRLRWLERQT